MTALMPSSSSRLTRAVAVLVGLVLPMSSRGESGNSLVVHPLSVAEVSEREEIELRKLFVAEVERLESDLVEPNRVRAVLKSLPHRTCSAAFDVNECLA